VLATLFVSCIPAPSIALLTDGTWKRLTCPHPPSVYLFIYLFISSDFPIGWVCLLVAIGLLSVSLDESSSLQLPVPCPVSGTRHRRSGPVVRFMDFSCNSPDADAALPYSLSESSCALLLVTTEPHMFRCSLPFARVPWPREGHVTSCGRRFASPVAVGDAPQAPSGDRRGAVTRPDGPRVGR
jgi:hypothetical protein